MKGLPRNKTRLFVTVQEGGSTGEIYTKFHNTETQAKAHVDSCRQATYRAFGPLEMPVYSWTERDGRAVALFEEEAAIDLAVKIGCRVALGQWSD